MSKMGQLFYEVTEIISKAMEYEDGETGMDLCIKMYCDDNKISEDVCRQAQKFAFEQSALEAGIPLAVIRGEKKLGKRDMNLDDIEITEFGDLAVGGHRYVDTFVQAAHWKSTGKDLTDSELDRLMECHHDFVHEKILEYIY